MNTIYLQFLSCMTNFFVLKRVVEPVASHFSNSLCLYYAILFVSLYAIKFGFDFRLVSAVVNVQVVFRFQCFVNA